MSSIIAPPRIVVDDGDEIRPGYWLARERLGLRRWGPPLPAVIGWFHTTAELGRPENRMDRSPFLAAMVGDEAVSIWCLQQSPRHDGGSRIFRCMREISAAEYAYQIADLGHARRYRLDDPKSTPRRAIDLAMAPPLYVRSTR